jgi:hypothetical protein
MRRVLRSLACVWIACQLAAIAAPIALACDAFGIDQVSCCPGIGPGQICPMHHKTASSRSTCRLESACGHHDTMLLTMIGVGILPPAAASIASSPIANRVDTLAASTLSRASVPDLPPPRLSL